jgi:succinate-semialdehyde dehydrogenase/glutarate-semialdehyde dehydrogenase
MSFSVVRPFDGAKLRDFGADTSPQVNDKILKAENCFQEWKKTDLTLRSRLLQRAADLLKEREEPLARLMTGEMGKLVGEARLEIKKSASGCEYYAQQAETFLSPVEIKTESNKALIVCRPLGILLAVMPWNFPFWQVIRAVAPALMAGNVVLLKHASNVPGCAEALEKLFLDAGYPEGCLTWLRIPGSGVEEVIAHPLVRAVTLTGSTPAGRSVGGLAGKHLKKCVLELGGSDAYVILEDADVAKAAALCVQGRLLNAGQSCISAKRFIVTEPVRERFTREVLRLFLARQGGDPLDDQTTLAPMARSNLREELHQQVLQSIKAGAQLLCGGKIPSGEGFWYPATLLDGVAPGMPAYEEELFGPVGILIPVKDKKEALAVANSSSFGLGAAVFTSDETEGLRIACDELEAGSCFVNDFVKSDPRLPFGGIKESGFGRELSGAGLREFINLKTVVLK